MVLQVLGESYKGSQGNQSTSKPKHVGSPLSQQQLSLEQIL